ncbi:MAG: hypothetical protein K2J20_05045 [Bacilli bacterium]|nr:hypothetical protein [Bacilli bacterium]
MNNSENSNEGLNTISLGSVGDVQNVNNIPPVPPVQPVAPVENLNPAPASNTEVVDTLQTNEVLQNNVSGAIPNVGVAPMQQPGDIPVPLTEEVGSIPMADSGTSIPPVAPLDTNGVIPSVEPVQPINEIPPIDNNFNAIPLTNGIGTVPPIGDSSLLQSQDNQPPEPKKKGMNKTIFIVIIILAIAAVGIALYVILGAANTGGGTTATGVIVKDVKIELGAQVSAEINDYATFNGINSSYCSLNTTEIKYTDVLDAEYDFTVTCNGKDYKGKAKVVDTIKPEVVARDVTVELNAEVKPEDFIESCTDKSACSYAFKDEEAVKNLMTQAGTTEVEIIVKDEAGNETTVTASLEVQESSTTEPDTSDNPTDPDNNQTQLPPASVYLVCSKDQTDYREVNSLGLNNGEFVGVATRDYVFTFSSSEEYQEAKGENVDGAQMTYKEITGKVAFDDNGFRITIKKTLTQEELNTESGTTLPTAFLELSSYYGSNGYSCELK